MFAMNPVHIGVLVEDIEKAMAYCTETLGVGPFQDFGELRETSFYYGKPGKLCYRAAMAPFGDLQLELIQPTADQSIFWDDLKKNGPGIHHICLKVDDAEAAAEECRRAGMEIREQVPLYEMEPGFSVGFFFVDTPFGMRLEMTQEEIAEA